MKLRLRRWWPLPFVLALLAGWWAAFNYLIDFRPPDVAFVTTPNDVIAAMFDLADVKPTDTVYDLGSGDGRVLIAAARDRGATAVGIELEPDLVASSTETVRAAGLADKITVRRGDIFKQDLGKATVITLYLKPFLNAQLRPQLDALPPGVRIVSHMFSMPGAKPVKVIEVPSAETGLEHRLYLWVTPIDWSADPTKPGGMPAPPSKPR